MNAELHDLNTYTLYPDTVFEAKRMTDGTLVRGQVVGAEPFVYILTAENYLQSRGHYIEDAEFQTTMRLIRVNGHSVRKISDGFGNGNHV